MEKLVSALGLTLEKKKKVGKLFRSLYGIGEKRSEKLLKILGFKKSLSLEFLEKESKKEMSLLLDFLSLKLKGNLKESLKERKLELVSLKLVRGIRNQRGYPVRGQRTRTNAKTAKKFKKRN